MSTVPSKAEEILDTLRTEILQGQYRAGERLPSERDLSARFESNRGAVREALKKLEQIGLVIIAPGGVRIQPLEEATVDVLGHLLALDATNKPELIGQVMDVLGSMMALSVRSSVAAATESELRELANHVDTLIKHMGDADRQSEAWRQFGESMMSIHGNLVLKLVGNGIRTQFIGSLATLDAEPDIELSELVDQLKELKSAIETGDATRASQALIEHFEIIKLGILEFAQRQSSDAPTQRRANLG